MASLSAQAQTWDEIFRQKKTQKKYLLQQLAALKLYADYLKKGYNIANTGINSIKGFTNGEFHLHADFFNSLKNVNPALANSGKIADIISWQTSIRKDLNSLTKASNFSGSDKIYFEAVRSKVLAECEFDLDELLLIITSGELEMKDDERIKRLEYLHRKMADKYQFTELFISQVKSLKMQQQQEKRNNDFSKEIYHIIN